MRQGERAEASNARLEAAQAKAQSAILRVMATLKLSPDEYRPMQDKDGAISFERVEQPPTKPTPKSQ